MAHEGIDLVRTDISLTSAYCKPSVRSCSEATWGLRFLVIAVAFPAEALQEPSRLSQQLMRLQHERRGTIHACLCGLHDFHDAA